MQSNKSPQQPNNVFEDCGFSPAEAENLRLRADMMLALRAFIEKKGLSKVAASERMRASQRQIADLVHGRIERLSAGLLLDMLTNAGLRVEIRITGSGVRAATTRKSSTRKPAA